MRHFHPSIRMLGVRYRTYGYATAPYSERTLFFRVNPCALDSGANAREAVTISTLSTQFGHRLRAGTAHSHPLQVQLNQLLAALPDAEIKRWLPELVVVDMPLGQVLYEAGAIEEYVYFPTTAIVSLLYVMQNGDSAEIAIVGNEGVVGFSLFMGGNSTPSRAVIQSAGSGLRMSARNIKAEFENSGPVMHLLLRYVQALITQMSQTAVCNRHHSLAQQLCRWLLLSLDRLPGNELVMTQELIANMLGVRREGVTEAALKLQEAGLIRYARGRITVLDRHGLEKRSCECYEVVKKEYDRLLPRQLST